MAPPLPPVPASPKAAALRGLQTPHLAVNSFNMSSCDYALSTGAPARRFAATPQCPAFPRRSTRLSRILLYIIIYYYSIFLNVTHAPLQVRGPATVSRYFKAAQPATMGDSWFPTGDVASLDRWGGMQITDRSKDVIKSGAWA